MSISCFFLVFLLIGSALRHIGSLPGTTSESLVSIIIDRFYFILTTYITATYRNSYPLDADRWIAGAEAFPRVFLMAYFTVAFVRKILR